MPPFWWHHTSRSVEGTGSFKLFMDLCPRTAGRIGSARALGGFPNRKNYPEGLRVERRSSLWGFGIFTERKLNVLGRVADWNAIIYSHYENPFLTAFRIFKILVIYRIKVTRSQHNCCNVLLLRNILNIYLESRWRFHIDIYPYDNIQA